MHHAIRRASTLASVTTAALLVVAALTACGSSGAPAAAGKGGPKKDIPSVDELYKQARASTAAAKSVHVKGDMTDSGKKFTLDLAGARSGDTVGTVTDADGTFELRHIGSTVYMRSSAAYWKKNAGADAAAMIGNKYLKLPPEASKGMDAFTVGAVIDHIFDEQSLSMLEKVSSKVEQTTLDGKPAYVLSERLDSNGPKIYLAADGTAHLLRLVGPKSEPGTMEFSEWDAVPPVKAPSASQIAKVPGS